jgi:hypothetical protein
VYRIRRAARFANQEAWSGTLKIEEEEVRRAGAHGSRCRDVCHEET